MIEEEKQEMIREEESDSDIDIPDMDEEFDEDDRPHNYQLDLFSIKKTLSSALLSPQISSYHTQTKSCFQQNQKAKLQGVSSKTEELKCWVNRTESLIGNA